jgi:RES domain-containing protein
LETIRRLAYAGHVWRSVREGRDPLACWRSGGRWDDGTFDVLYTSETREAAIEERRFHLYQGQPIPPSRVRYELFELSVSLEAVIVFESEAALAAVGLDVGSFGQLSYFEKDREYPRSQEIAEACCFLGADGILVPSARNRSSKNLIVFCEQDTAIAKNIVRNHGTIDWKNI